MGSRKGDVIMDVTEIKKNKLKTILRFSIPSIIAMLLETVITITDWDVLMVDLQQLSLLRSQRTINCGNREN